MPLDHLADAVIGRIRDADLPPPSATTPYGALTLPVVAMPPSPENPFVQVAGNRGNQVVRQVRPIQCH